MLTLALLIALTPIDVTVIVPLCDGSKLACGSAAAGDPRALDTNLYWGAMYGAERYLAKAKGFRVISKVGVITDPATGPMRTVVLERTPAAGERAVRMTLHAYDGARIDDALAAFLEQARAPSSALVVWAGHDRLMDVPAPTLPIGTRGANVAVLACESEKYFGPVLDALGAHPVALTRTFMAPEAYLLEALARNVAQHGAADRTHLREALVDAYAKFQRISKKAAGTVFSRL